MDFLAMEHTREYAHFHLVRRLLISAASLVLSLTVDSSVSILFPWCWEIRSRENVLGVTSACLI
jgi:hypothetical protein